MPITAAEKRRAECNRKYQQSDKGRATILKYNQSDKRRAYLREYSRSDKGRASLLRYKQSDKGRATIRKYEKSDKRRAGRLKYLYDLSPEIYEAMFQSQGGLCAICRKPPSAKVALHVDHDHVTGRVRGLLCPACNTSLGGFRDSSAICLAAATYIASTNVT